MAIKHIGNGFFVDTDTVDPPEGTSSACIYPYADFRSLEHVSFGLRLTTGGPQAEEVDSREVGEYGMEPIAPYQEFGYAIEELEKDSRWAFEEVPYVEVETEEQYNEALEALELDEGDGDWKGPGLYDFRDAPPTFSGSVEDYELESMQDAADQAFDFMFQSEEWEDTYRELAGAEEEENE